MDEKDKPKFVPAVDEDKTKFTPVAETDVDVVMLSAVEGEIVNRWLIGPAVGVPLTECYDFRPCCPTTVNAKDAKALLAGGAWTRGRKFVRADSTEGRTALSGAPKAAASWGNR